MHRDHPSFYLTFDGAPNPPGTDAVLGALNRHGIRATFFLEGHRLVDGADCARRIVDAGHEIGNHSYSHPRLDELSVDEALVEILRAREIILRATGVLTDQFRPPWGRLRPAMTQAILASGHDLVLWNRSVRDWEGPDAAAIAERVLAGLSDGTIVVLHDRIPENPDVLDLVVPRILDAGYTFALTSDAPASQAIVRRSATSPTSPTSPQDSFL
ncbi:MAG: polysaccharide deacetylase family protein [Acidimicrobiales bacterium]